MLAELVRWVSRGGEDNVENMVLLCPGRNVAVYRCNAPSHYGDPTFVFPNHCEPLQYNTHLHGSA